MKHGNQGGREQRRWCPPGGIEMKVLSKNGPGFAEAKGSILKKR
jgi:hypothetical protein